MPTSNSLESYIAGFAALSVADAEAALQSASERAIAAPDDRAAMLIALGAFHRHMGAMPAPGRIQVIRLADAAVRAVPTCFLYIMGAGVDPSALEGALQHAWSRFGAEHAAVVVFAAVLQARCADGADGAGGAGGAGDADDADNADGADGTNGAGGAGTEAGEFVLSRAVMRLYRPEAAAPGLTTEMLVAALAPDENSAHARYLRAFAADPPSLAQIAM